MHMKQVVHTLVIILCPLFGLSQVSPIDFEDNGVGQDWTWTCFENDTDPPLEIVDNPDPSGINTSAKVAKFTALKSGKPWAGCESKHGEDIGTFNITQSNSQIRIMVYKPVISDVGIKLVTSTNASLGEMKIANTKVNEWEQLTFDFSSHIGGMTYDQIVIFPDFNTRDSNTVVYFDNVYGDSASQNSSVIDMQISHLSIYPNPGKDQVSIHSTVQPEQIEIYSVDGRLVYSNKSPLISQTVNVVDWAAGIYTVKAFVGGVVQSKKLVVSE